MVVEVRHVSWASAEAEEWFGDRGVGWCAVDQPQVGRSTAGVLPRVTGPVAYLRLHGRNAADWFRAGAGRDARYDYLYTAEQMEELATAAGLADPRGRARAPAGTGVAAVPVSARARRPRGRLPPPRARSDD